MSDSFNFVSYRFLIDNTTLSKCYINSKALFYNILEYFYHNWSHNLYMYFLKVLIPLYMKLRLFLPTALNLGNICIGLYPPEDYL